MRLKRQTTLQRLSIFALACLFGMGCAAQSEQTSGETKRDGKRPNAQKTDESEGDGERETSESDDQPDRPRPPESLEEGDYVLLAPGTTLHLAVNRERWASVDEQPLLAEYVSTSDRWVRVRGVENEKSRACSVVAGEAPDVRFEVLVTADDLHRVVTTSTGETYDDGTRWKVRPGIPVREKKGSETTRLLFADGHVELPVPDEHVGWSFRPEEPLESESEQRIDVPEAYFESGRIGDRGRLKLSRDLVMGDVTDRDDGSQLLGLTTPCLKFRARFGADVSLKSESGGSGGMGLRAAVGGVRVEDGTTVSNPEGARIGVSAPGLLLHDTETENGRVCGRPGLYWIVDRPPRGCVDASATE